MKRFIVTFAATGGITIEANDEHDALRKFENISDTTLFDELRMNGIEQTDIFEETEE